MMLVPVLAMTSCHDDNDLPDVDFDITFENAVEVDNQMYIAKGDTLKVTGITVINNESDDAALITSASYYWDGYYIGSNNQPPFGFEFCIGENVPVGKHEIDITCPIYAVDKSPAIGTVFFYVNVVESQDDIPAGGDYRYTISPKITSSVND